MTQKLIRQNWEKTICCGFGGAVSSVLPGGEGKVGQWVCRAWECFYEHLLVSAHVVRNTAYTSSLVRETREQNEQ